MLQKAGFIKCYKEVQSSNCQEFLEAPEIPNVWSTLHMHWPFFFHLTDGSDDNEEESAVENEEAAKGTGQ